MVAITDSDLINIKVVIPQFKKPSTSSCVETCQAFMFDTTSNPPILILTVNCPAIAPDPIPSQTQPGMAQRDHWPFRSGSGSGSGLSNTTAGGTLTSEQTGQNFELLTFLTAGDHNGHTSGVIDVRGWGEPGLWSTICSTICRSCTRIQRRNCLALCCLCHPTVSQEMQASGHPPESSFLNV